MPSNDSRDACYIFTGWKRPTSAWSYEGIPLNLLINIFGWFLMIIIFSYIRKRAWNYGRIALVQKIDDRTAPSYYYGTLHPKEMNELDATDDQSVDQSETPSPGSSVEETTSFQPNADKEIKNNNDTRQEQLNNENEKGDSGDKNVSNKNEPPDGNDDVDGNDEQESLNIQANAVMASVNDHGFFSWILITIRLTDEQILSRSGPDAMHYLRFQRHLIFISSVIAFACITIVLPIHILRGEDDNDSPTIRYDQFETGTISHLRDNSKFLWVHVIFSIMFLFLTIIVMRHFSSALKFVDEDSPHTRTIMITGISRSTCHEEKLRWHFEEIYPDVDLLEVNFAYDISRLQSVEFARLTAIGASKHCQNYFRRKGKRPKMRPFTCGTICCICKYCGSKPADSIEFYAKEEERLTRECELEKKRALKKPLGIAFITFRSLEMAMRVVSDYRLTAKCLSQTPLSKYSRKLRSSHWIVNFAPLPADIYWENLNLGYKAWYFKAILTNMTLLLFVIFYSTPVFLLKALSKHLLDGYSGKVEEKKSDNWVVEVINSTIPTIMLWLAAVTLPSFITLSDKIIGFWTKTAENRSRMFKSFSFLLLMVIILPSLGLTSIALRDDKPRQGDWGCIFWKDNGVFFVNYAITSTFLGTTSELMRLPELFVYTVKVFWSRSTAELAGIRKSVFWEFQLGAQYAWMMLNFAIITIFSLIYPIITPIGIIYLVLKHHVDRYNIFFAYDRCKVDKEVHGTAINFAIVCMFILQVIVLAYTKPLSPDSNKPIQVFSIVGFCITAALFIGQIFFNMCANFSPILYKTFSDPVPSFANDVKTPPGSPLQQDSPDHVVTLQDDPNGSIGTVNESLMQDRDRQTNEAGRYIPTILRGVEPSTANDVERAHSSTFSYIDEREKALRERHITTPENDSTDNKDKEGSKLVGSSSEDEHKSKSNAKR